MLVFQAQTILILLSIGSQRCLAIMFGPASADYSLESPVGELKDNHASHTSHNEEKGHQWDCQADSDYIREQISLSTKLLSDGEKVIQKQKQLSTKETILVLGKAGSGKTSLVQFLTQNPKLQSKRIRSDTGEYIIEDGKKIGTSATESFTLYPELVNFNSSVTFCDSPGFHDSRSSAHEVASMNVMKSVTSTFKKVKILLLEKQGSLQYGVSKDSFINTLKHLIDSLINIDKYKDHIVLIATKIPFAYKMPEDNDSPIPELITEDMHIESIMDYLNHTETSIAGKLNEKMGKSKKDFYQKVVKLLQSLQTRDENGKATKINIFRRPYKSGSLVNMPLLQKNKESLTKTIMNLDFVEAKNNDFDFTLSNEAKMYLECLLKFTSDSYKNKINALSFNLKEFIAQKTENYSSFDQVLKDFESFHNALKQLSENLDETKNYNEFFDKVNDFISDQKISSQINYNEQIHVLEKYEEMLLKFVDTNLMFTPSSWTLPIRQVMKSTEDELYWYKFLNKFIKDLSSYKVQKNKTEIYSTIFKGDSLSINDLMSLFQYLDITENLNLRHLIDDKRESELIGIANSLLLHKNNITCNTNGRLIIKGFQICIAEINLEDLVQSHCNNVSVKEVAILAVETVFLDEDTIDMFRGVNMFIAAPKWEVIGQRQIVLSGRPGSEISADNPYVANGKDGKPGLPGDNGGSFFGIGLEFVNGKNLHIESNGGRGGPGANGAKGATGLAGRDAVEKLKSGNSYHSIEFQEGAFNSDLDKVLSHKINLTAIDLATSGYLYAAVTVITQNGDCGSNGASGGLGGESGMGGLPGDQQLIELSESSQIGMQNKNGSTGTRGNMGETGDRGPDGIGMICVHVKNTQYPRSYWNCKATNITSPSCNVCQEQDDTFKYQYTTTGIEQPAPKNVPDFSYYLLDYTVLLESHSNHTIFKKVITDFQQSVQRKFSYTLSDLGLLFLRGYIQPKS